MWGVRGEAGQGRGAAQRKEGRNEGRKEDSSITLRSNAIAESCSSLLAGVGRRCYDINSARPDHDTLHVAVKNE